MRCSDLEKTIVDCLFKPEHLKYNRKKKLIMTSFTPEELVELFRPMIKEIILSIVGEKEEKLLSPAKTCELFDPPISKTTLATWTKQGLIDDHRIGRNVYYKLSEILEKSKMLGRYKLSSISLPPAYTQTQNAPFFLDIYDRIEPAAFLPEFYSSHTRPLYWCANFLPFS